MNSFIWPSDIQLYDHVPVLPLIETTALLGLQRIVMDADIRPEQFVEQERPRRPLHDLLIVRTGDRWRQFDNVHVPGLHLGLYQEMEHPVNLLADKGQHPRMDIFDERLHPMGHLAGTGFYIYPDDGEKAFIAFNGHFSDPPAVQAG